MADDEPLDPFETPGPHMLQEGSLLFQQLAELPDAKTVHRAIAGMSLDDLRVIVWERVWYEAQARADYRRWQGTLPPEEHHRW